MNPGRENFNNAHQLGLPFGDFADKISCLENIGSELAKLDFYLV